MGKSLSTARQAESASVVRQVPKRVVERPTVDRKVREIPTMEFLEKASKSDQDFGKSIKNIFVTSINKTASLDIAADLLPRNREATFKAHAHNQTVEKRSPNKLLVSEIKTILDNHKHDPDTWTIEYVAENYQIDQSKIAKLLKNYSTPQMFCEDFPSESNQSIPKPPESWKRMHGEMTREELAECMAPPGGKTFLTAMERRDQIFRKK